MTFHSNRRWLTFAMTALLASCGGGGTMRIETKFPQFHAPYASPNAMRQALQTAGVTMYALRCGFTDIDLGTSVSGPPYFMEAAIDRADGAKALAAGPFTEVTAASEARRGLDIPCGD